MKERLQQVVDDALSRNWPVPKRRDVVVKSHRDMVSVLVGMRRTGKTWLCFQKMCDLVEQGTSRDRILYLNFEDDRLTGLSAEQLQWLTEFYYARNPANREKECHFFFDEIQNVPGWEKFVRRLLDSENVRITITGSSAKLLSKEIATCLRGRALTTEVFPLDFPEFGRFHDLSMPSGGNFGAVTRSRVMQAMDSYLLGGGFPAVQDMAPEMRHEVLQNYVDVVLLRDIIERHHVTNVPVLRALARHLLQNPATGFSVTRFYGQLKAEGMACTRDTLHLLLGYLEDAYLVFPVELYARSAQRRRVNPRKVYLADTGLQSAFSVGQTPDRGARLENLVFLALRSKGFPVSYGLTESGHEVDFIYTQGGRPHLVQACWSMEQSQTREREIRALKAMVPELPGASCTVVTWMDEGEEAGIPIVPVWKWLLSR
ncbi:MAG: ATP-binding protein [bacterium]